MAFGGSSANRLDEISVSSFVFVITFHVHILLHSRLSVTVIPRSDAESRKAIKPACARPFAVNVYVSFLTKNLKILT